MGTKYIIGERFQYISPDGKTFDFDAGMRYLLTFEGLGMPAHEFITNQGPGQHGQTVVGMRYQTRMIQVLVGENGDSRFDYWSMRKNWINMLRPDRQNAHQFKPGEFRVLLPDMSTRAIKVLLAEGLSFSARNLDTWDEWGVQEVVRFVAHNPFWFEPPGYTVQLTYSVAPPTNLVFPFTFRNPVTNPYGQGMQLSFAGEPDFYLTNAFTYPGERESFPTITIVGPVKGPVVQNETTGERIALNYQVVAGETITITLEYGNKVVTSTRSGDITGVVTSDSQLTTFHIAADPESGGGYNKVSFSGTAPANGVTQTRFDFYGWYTGV